VSPEAFTAAEIHEILSCNQQLQLVQITDVSGSVPLPVTLQQSIQVFKNIFKRKPLP
jgi:hypothetical protein